jgi:hypothetical protein
MPPDEEEPRSRYDGPFVVIRPEGLDYIVAVEPVLPTGEGEPRTFATKHDAFGAARVLWTEHRLPVRDCTIPETARAHPDE